MKFKIFIYSIMILAMFSSCTNAQNKKNTSASNIAEKKVLMAYYSRTNNTEQVAENIQSFVGGDFFRIETQKSYPAEYEPATEVAKKEKDADERPVLTAQVDNIEQYDIIFIGFPIWWGDTPMAIATFLESYDLSGKTIIPFCSHGGGGVGEAFNRVKKLTPNSTNLEGLVVSGSGRKSKVENWLLKIDIISKL